jgi:hypothetical protein
LKKFELTIEIDPGRGRDVPLEDFERELRALTGALMSADDFVSSGNRSTDFFVKDLHHSTPTIVLEARSIAPGRDVRAEVISHFMGGISELLRSGRLPANFSADTVECLRDLTSPIGEGIRETRISWGDSKVIVGIELKDRLKRIKISDDREVGEVDGLLEQINIHGTTSTFRIYPVVGPEFVTCEFDEALATEVQESLGKYVVASGEIRYRRGARFPYRAVVESIAVVSELEQPTLAEIRGISPYATHDEETVDFIQRLRDGW